MKKYSILLLLLFLNACGQSNKEKIIGQWLTTDHAMEFMKEGKVIIHLKNGEVEEIKYSFLSDEKLMIGGCRAMIGAENTKLVLISFDDENKTLVISNTETNKNTIYSRTDNLNEIVSKWKLYKDLSTIASIVQQYYRKPKAMGGGGGSFDGLSLFSMFPKFKKMNNYVYDYKQISADEVIITGTSELDSSQTIEAIVTPFEIKMDYE